MSIKNIILDNSHGIDDKTDIKVHVLDLGGEDIYPILKLTVLKKGENAPPTDISSLNLDAVNYQVFWIDGTGVPRATDLVQRTADNTFVDIGCIWQLAANKYEYAEPLQATASR